MGRVVGFIDAPPTSWLQPAKDRLERSESRDARGRLIRMSLRSIRATRYARPQDDQGRRKLRVRFRQNRLTLGYGRSQTHSTRSMALREFSNEIRLYGACRWEP
jgi:hypothetical protein